MRRCPQCNRSETDEALKFCRVDGATLVIDSSAFSSEAGTAQLGSSPDAREVHTSILPHNTNANVNRATAPTTLLPPQAVGPTFTDFQITITRRLNRKKLAVIGIAVFAAVVALIAIANRSRNRSIAEIQSVAVMPFVNESGDTNVEYLADGMTETLIRNLSLLPGVKVKARSSVFRYKGKETDAKTIGRDLGVQAVLNGRFVGGRGELLHLSLELVDAQTENVIWTDNYDRKPSELILLQNAIARDVSSKLGSQLSGTERKEVAKNYTENAEAYQLYLQGRFFWNKRTVDDFKRAISCFEKALAIDPNYALALTGLADSYALLSVYDGAPPKESMPKAKEAALRALALDNELAEAHASLGQILQNYEYNFREAEHEYKRAIQLNPNYASAHQWYGELLGNLGRFDESEAELQVASEIDPFNLVINRMKGAILFYARKYDASIEQSKKTVGLDPNFPGGHAELSSVYHVKGQYAESVDEYAKMTELIGDKDGAAVARDSFSKGGWVGFLRAMTDEARRPLGVRHFHLAFFHVALGEKKIAIDELNASYDERASDMIWLKQDPRFDPLRGDPRFQQLLENMGFPQ